MSSTRRPPAWVMLSVGALVSLVVLVFARLAYGLILPPMRESLGLTYQQAGNLGTVTALGYLCLVMPAGALAARRGGRAAVLLGLILVTAGFVGLSLASAYPLLLGGMALLGVGTAFAYTPLVSLLVNWFPGHRGTVIGLLNSGVGLGMAICGALIPYLSQTYGNQGWRITWVIFAAGALLVSIAVFLVLRDPPLHSSPAVSAPPPVDKWSVYRNSHVIKVGLLYGVTGLTYTVQTIFMFSFALEAGLPPLTAGRLSALMGLLSIFSAPCWGWLADRFGRGNALLVLMTLTLLATAIPVVWPVLPGFIVHFTLIGGTISGLFTSVLAVATEQVQAREAPLAVSYVTLFYAVGQFLGPAAAGQLIDSLGGFRPTFAISCLVMGSGVYLSWLIRTSKNPSVLKELRSCPECGQGSDH